MALSELNFDLPIWRVDLNLQQDLARSSLINRECWLRLLLGSLCIFGNQAPVSAGSCLVFTVVLRVLNRGMRLFLCILLLLVSRLWRRFCLRGRVIKTEELVIIFVCQDWNCPFTLCNGELLVFLSLIYDSSVSRGVLFVLWLSIRLSILPAMLFKMFGESLHVNAIFLFIVILLLVLVEVLLLIIGVVVLVATQIG